DLSGAGEPRPEERQRQHRRRDGRRRTRESRMMSKQRGFTIAELITVVAIIGILASVAVPIASFGIRRQKEIKLRERLRPLTSAIDQYHDLRLQPPGNP